MLINSFSDLFKDVIIARKGHKYKLNYINQNNEGNNKDEVVCTYLDSGKCIKFALDDVINNKLQFFESKDILTILGAFNSKNTRSAASNMVSKYYSMITVAFTILLLLSNIAESKICNFFGYSIGAGTIVFPLLYVLSDVTNEVYGFKANRKIIWTAFFYSCFFSLFIYLVYKLPPSSSWQDQEAFEKIFLVSPQIVIGSVTSYLLGEMINGSIIYFLRIRYNGRYFALRAVFSTLIGSFLESSMFALIAFWGRITMQELIEMAFLLAFIKVSYEILIMPVTIKFLAYLKKEEGEIVTANSF